MPLRSLRERQEHDRTVFLFLQRNQKKKRTEILAFGVVFGMLPLAFANGLKNGVRLVIADVTRLRFTPDSMTDRTLIFENVGGVCLRSASVGQAVVVSRSVALFQQETKTSQALPRRSVQHPNLLIVETHNQMMTYHFNVWGQ